MSKPLDQVLKEITPLPYRVDGLELVAGVSDSGPLMHAVIRSDSERWVALAEVTDAEGDANAAYLAHAANVLPELVDAFESVATQAAGDLSDAAFREYIIRAIVNPALARATSVNS